MRAVEIKRLRAQLERKRRDVFESYRKAQAENREATNEGLQDLADQATESYRKEFLYSLTDSERHVLRQVDDALSRMDDGIYDECQNCGKRIDARRLKAIPWASLCLDCQELMEAKEKRIG